MKVLVTLQTRPVRELLVALLALVRSLPGVDDEVAREAVLLVEVLPAVLAHVADLPRAGVVGHVRIGRWRRESDRRDGCVVCTGADAGACAGV